MEHTDIRFPNLGITLENVGSNINLFGLDIAFYGMAIGLGVLAGILMALWTAKRTGQNEETYIDLALWTVVLSIAGARLYYVIFHWDLYRGDLLSILNLRQGGLAIYGGVIAGVVVVFIFAKKKKMSFPLLVDTACIGLITGQIIGRWGNFFNREAFGGYTDNLLAMQIPVDAARSGDITADLTEKIVQIGSVDYIQVHPTFLYEGVWNLAVLAILLFITAKKKYDGQVFLIYLLGYGLGRMWIEGLRTDQLLIPGTEIPVSQVLSVILVIVSIVIMVMKHKAHKVE